MPLSLEQYAAYLDSRDLVWPEPPPPQAPKARPHLVRMPHVRAVVWNVYGTLLSIFSGQLLFEHPQKLVMDIALDKTVQEYKMWGSMTRKPGQPSAYMGEMYRNVLNDLKLAPSTHEKFPLILAERIWEALVKKLQKKEYKYDDGMLGSLPEFSRKVAYFFHASLQGTACYDGAAVALEGIHRKGVKQGLLADTQCFTFLQLQRGLMQQPSNIDAKLLFAPDLRSLSHELGARKPSDRVFRHCATQLAGLRIAPIHVLHVGSRIVEDIVPAKKLGMRTALFAGDKDSLQATAEQMKDPASRPDVLLTDLMQISEVVGTE